MIYNGARAWRSGPDVRLCGPHGKIFRDILLAVERIFQEGRGVSKLHLVGALFDFRWGPLCWVSVRIKGELTNAFSGREEGLFGEGPWACAQSALPCPALHPALN